MTSEPLFEILIKFNMFDCIGAILTYLHVASFWVRKLKIVLENLPVLGSNRFMVLVETFQKVRSEF